MIVRFDDLQQNHIYRITHSSFSRNEPNHWINTIKYIIPSDELVFVEYGGDDFLSGPFRLMKSGLKESYKKQLYEDLGLVYESKEARRMMRKLFTANSVVIYKI